MAAVLRPTAQRLGLVFVSVMVLTLLLTLTGMLTTMVPASDSEATLVKNEQFRRMVISLADTQFLPQEDAQQTQQQQQQQQRQQQQQQQHKHQQSRPPQQQQRKANAPPDKETPRTFIGNPPMEVFDLTLHPPVEVVPLLTVADQSTPTCKDMLARRDSIWPAHFGERRQLTVMLLGIGLRGIKERAVSVGGPMGELIFFMSVAHALLCSGHRVVVVDDATHLQGVHLSEYDAFYTERLWIGTPEVLEELHVKELFPCRARFLDFYGISARFVPEPYGVRQVLTTYPWTTGNDFVGLAIHDRIGPDEMRPREPFGVIWGKEPKYFQLPEVIRLLQALNGTKLVATINKVKLSREKIPVFLPPNVENLGTMSRSQLIALFRRCTFVLGLRDPVLGPTGMEAVANGAVFLNPTRKERTHTYNWDDNYESQHPYLGKLGPPWVYTYDLDHPEQLVPIVKTVMENPLKAPHPLEDFTLEAMANKVIRNIVDPTVCPPDLRAEVLGGAAP